MPYRSTPVCPSPAALLAASVLLVVPAAAQQPGGSFRDGTCSGLLCDYIGGSQATAARQQTSLFREGECGGVLCDAIGGSQAPRHAEPPPPCGGGLLCDMMPYKMGVPVTAAEAARRQEAERHEADRHDSERQDAERKTAATAPKARHRRRKAGA